MVHVDLALSRHYWWVTKRLAKGLFADPPGWPEGSPLWRSSLSSYRTLIRDAADTETVHHLTSPKAIATFLASVSP